MTTETAEFDDFEMPDALVFTEAAAKKVKTLIDEEIEAIKKKVKDSKLMYSDEYQTPEKEPIFF